MTATKDIGNEYLRIVLAHMGIRAEEMSDDEKDKAYGLGYSIQNADPELVGLFLGALMAACRLFMEEDYLA